MESAASENAPWYRAGLRFACTECGACCTGGQGYVWVGEAEARVLAGHLGLGLDDFGRRYLRRVGRDYALLEAPGDGACVFLQERRCRVYAARPRQCRSFPFWDAILASPGAWAKAAEACEGICDDAPLLDRQVVELRRRG